MTPIKFKKIGEEQIFDINKDEQFTIADIYSTSYNADYTVKIYHFRRSDITNHTTALQKEWITFEGTGHAEGNKFVFYKDSKQKTYTTRVSEGDKIKVIAEYNGTGVGNDILIHATIVHS